VKFPVADPGDLQPALAEVGATPRTHARRRAGGRVGGDLDHHARGPSPATGRSPTARTSPYGLYEVEAIEEGLPFAPWSAPGDRLIVADKLADEVRAAAKVARWRRVQDVDPAPSPACTRWRRRPGYRYPVPLLAGAHVTDDAGTGFVHTAPSHGQEDYQVWLASGPPRHPRHGGRERRLLRPRPPLRRPQVLETEGKKAGKFGPPTPPSSTS
jgi:hypothetical protein